MKVYLSLGSNKEDRYSYIKTALDLIEGQIGSIFKKSSVYKTQSWGYCDSEYLNMCIGVECDRGPENLILMTQAIERQIGRTEKTHNIEQNKPVYKAREIDIDILFCDDLIIDQNAIKIPHPGIPHRMFILKPLDQIAHNFVHPVLKKTIGTLLIQCTDNSYVEEYHIPVNPI
jgi:2-amino-4-hydroxy-6-hydroxymethyldihydropteridine diphosphokinase